jgi:AraC family transcriptional regulator
MASCQEEIDVQPAKFSAEHPSGFIMRSSGTAAWNSLLLEHLKFPALDISDMCATRHHLTLQLRMPKKVELKTNGKFTHQRLLPGNVCITPFQHPHGIRWHDRMEVLSLTLEPKFVTQAAREFVNPDRVELTMHRGQKDPLIREILFALKAELEAGCPSGRLYGEAMGTALAVHLLKQYSTLKSPVATYEDGLPQHRLDEVLDYIQTYLDRDIKLIELAELVDMSQYHFCRLFKQSTGVPPHQFVLQQRIERAKQLLQQKNLAIADIALSCGFKSQSHLTTLFRKFTGSTPKAFRNL